MTKKNGVINRIKKEGEIWQKDQRRGGRANLHCARELSLGAETVTQFPK